MDIFDAIFGRRSIRRYLNKPVGHDLIKKILKAAMTAPSSGNAQPWHFVIIDDRKILDDISKYHPYAKALKTAGTAILVCGDLRLNKESWIQDCSAAAQNMLLAAYALGLGTVWQGIYPDEIMISETVKLFRLPGEIIPFAVIAIGYPAEPKGPTQRYNPSRIHRNKWTEVSVKKHIPPGFTFIGENTYSCGENTNTLQEFYHKKSQMEFVLVPEGTFVMGSTSAERELAFQSEERKEPHDYFEAPRIEVTLEPFLIAKYPVTQGQWQHVMDSTIHRKCDNTNPKLKVCGVGNFFPMYCVTFEECEEFCRKVGLELPSEAQWEYACRAGNKGMYCFGDDISRLPDYAWYYQNSGRDFLGSDKKWNREKALGEWECQSHPVGEKEPNAFGLYDMHGNVWEWCQDVWHESYEGFPVDGSAWIGLTPGISEVLRVIRGGSWDDYPSLCRSASRDAEPQVNFFRNYLGFRPVKRLTGNG